MRPALLLVTVNDPGADVGPLGAVQGYVAAALAHLPEDRQVRPPLPTQSLLAMT